MHGSIFCKFYEHLFIDTKFIRKIDMYKHWKYTSVKFTSEVENFSYIYSLKKKYKNLMSFEGRIPDISSLIATPQETLDYLLVNKQ